MGHSTHCIIILECIRRTRSWFLYHHARRDYLSWWVSQHGVILCRTHVTIIRFLWRLSFVLAMLFTRRLIWTTIRIVLCWSSLISNVHSMFLLECCYMHFTWCGLLWLIKTFLVWLLLVSYYVTSEYVSRSIQTYRIDINWNTIIDCMAIKGSRSSLCY